MAIDAHPSSPETMLADVQIAADQDLDDAASWTETLITVIAAAATIVFVSVIAMLMAMA
jgi:hypothetical protein